MDGSGRRAIPRAPVPGRIIVGDPQANTTSSAQSHGSEVQANKRPLARCKGLSCECCAHRRRSVEHHDDSVTARLREASSPRREWRGHSLQSERPKRARLDRQYGLHCLSAKILVLQARALDVGTLPLDEGSRRRVRLFISPPASALFLPRTPPPSHCTFTHIHYGSTDQGHSRTGASFTQVAHRPILDLLETTAFRATGIVQEPHCRPSISDGSLRSQG